MTKETFRVITHDEMSDETTQKDFTSWAKAIGYMTSQIIQQGETNSHMSKFTLSIERQ